LAKAFWHAAHAPSLARAASGSYDDQVGAARARQFEQLLLHGTHRERGFHGNGEVVAQQLGIFLEPKLGRHARLRLVLHEHMDEQ
jgi:hypothetical protein